ncbi:hypothetical protein [Pseudomonas zeae]|uniref:hypothetical protein n=1 Tax=Pseudomonas zeae TaxID=2745510 RepID=UPI0039DF6005
MNAEKTRRRIMDALYLIDSASNPLRVQCSTTYASGYINALQDEQIISADGAQYYREEVVERRKRRLAFFGVDLDADSTQSPTPGTGSA